MIGRLNGVLIEKDNSMILVETGGVGYEVEVPLTTSQSLPEVGDSLILYTHFVVREDAQLLYGFGDQQQRRLFRILIRISGIGPKVALALLSAMGIDDLISCISNDDVTRLVKVPGIGRKTAERLIIEIRDRLKEWRLELPSSAQALTRTRAGHFEEAESALVSLGFKPQEAAMALSRVVDGEQLEIEELIKRALKVIN